MKMPGINSVMPSDSQHTSELRQSARHWLSECDAVKKSTGVRQLAKDWAAGQMSLDTAALLSPAQIIPGHPAKPALVSPFEVKRRAMNTPEGRATMVHALLHIEFNAINLALDAMWRFPNMPREYYADWLRVADEEALHFDLLATHLNTLGFAYGDFTAHNGLWDWAAKTEHDVLARMALLPRTMEARGLDVTPGTKAKLVQAGDAAVAPVMDIILRDEIGHVAIGDHWFKHVCVQRGLEPVTTYRALAAEYRVPEYSGPFNLEARRAAGFSEQELAALEARTVRRTSHA